MIQLLPTISLYIVIAFETSILLVLGYFYFLQQKKLAQLKNKEVKLKDADYAKRRAEKILENAREKYSEIVNASYQKAEKIIKDAKVFNDDTKEEVLAQLRDSIKSVSLEIRQEALNEVEQYGKDLESQVKESEEAAKRVVEQNYDEVNAEISAYKQKKLSEIDGQAKKAIAEIAKDFFGETIDTEKNTDALITALENAKRKNIL